MAGTRALGISFAASLAILGWGRGAHAEIIHFVNPPEGEPGHFNWHWQGEFAEEGPEHWLDITLPPTMQEGLAGPSSVGQLCFCDGVDSTNRTDGAGAVAQIPDSLRTQALLYGDPVDGQIFGKHSVHVWVNSQGEVESDLEPGETGYWGVMTQFGNLGWIHVRRGLPGGDPSLSYFALAWAYETIPGKPIDAGEIPAPGTLALLAFGAVVTTRTRRRRRA